MWENLKNGTNYFFLVSNTQDDQKLKTNYKTTTLWKGILIKERTKTSGDGEGQAEFSNRKLTQKKKA